MSNSMLEGDGDDLFAAATAIRIFGAIPQINKEDSCQFQMVDHPRSPNILSAFPLPSSDSDETSDDSLHYMELIDEGKGEEPGKEPRQQCLIDSSQFPPYISTPTPLNPEIPVLKLQKKFRRIPGKPGHYAPQLLIDFGQERRKEEEKRRKIQEKEKRTIRVSERKETTEAIREFIKNRKGSRQAFCHKTVEIPPAKESSFPKMFHLFALPPLKSVYSSRFVPPQEEMNSVMLTPQSVPPGPVVHQYSGFSPISQNFEKYGYENNQNWQKDNYWNGPNYCPNGAFYENDGFQPVDHFSSHLANNPDYHSAVGQFTNNFPSEYWENYENPPVLEDFSCQDLLQEGLPPVSSILRSSESFTNYEDPPANNSLLSNNYWQNNQGAGGFDGENDDSPPIWCPTPLLAQVVSRSLTPPPVNFQKGQEVNIFSQNNNINMENKGSEEKAMENEKGKKKKGSRTPKETKHSHFKTKAQKDFLENEFLKDNCPPRLQLDRISCTLQLTLRQVQIWFYNKRAKAKMLQPRNWNGHGKRRSLAK